LNATRAASHLLLKLRSTLRSIKWIAKVAAHQNNAQKELGAAASVALAGGDTRPGTRQQENLFKIYVGKTFLFSRYQSSRFPKKLQ
jgi:hypothetical protein